MVKLEFNMQQVNLDRTSCLATALYRKTEGLEGKKDEAYMKQKKARLAIFISVQNLGHRRVHTTQREIFIFFLSEMI